MRGFISFIREQGVMGLAIGFLLGGAVSRTVTALVDDIINPLIGLGLHRVGELDDVVIQIGDTDILLGSFLSTVLDFVIIAAVIYFIFKGLHLDKIDKAKKK